MDKVHRMASLAPRDIVARAIHHELANSGEPCVYLDLSALDKSSCKTGFLRYTSAALSTVLISGTTRFPLCPRPTIPAEGCTQTWRDAPASCTSMR